MCVCVRERKFVLKFFFFGESEFRSHDLVQKKKKRKKEKKKRETRSPPEEASAIESSPGSNFKAFSDTMMALKRPTRTNWPGELIAQREALVVLAAPRCHHHRNLRRSLTLSSCSLPLQLPPRTSLHLSPARLQTITRASNNSSSNSFPPPSSSSLEARLGTLASSAASSFPFLLLAAASLALVKPELFLWFEEYVTAALALTMMTMGSTLTAEDFETIAAKPKRVALGALLQFSLMPLAGLAVSRLLCSASRADAVGICMVAACPGGVASNVVAFVARADVPLSVAMTTTSTLAATVATPLIARMLLGTVVPVDGLALLKSTAAVVLAPVVVGAGAAAAFPRLVKRFAPFAPLVAVAATVAVCGTVIARSSEVLLASLGALVGGMGGAASSVAGGVGSRALPAAVLLHLLGFASGYFVSKFLCGLPEKQARTNSIEVGMQNSALGAVLVLAHFPALGAAAAAPCAVSACVHSLIGSALASYWSKRDPEAMDLARAAGRGR